VVLRHSRIYILPTKRGWAMIATIAIMLVSSLNYALTLGIGVAFLLAGLMAAALLHTFRNWQASRSRLCRPSVRRGPRAVHAVAAWRRHRAYRGGPGGVGARAAVMFPPARR
jgi:hypothetical protein